MNINDILNYVLSLSFITRLFASFSLFFGLWSIFKRRNIYTGGMFIIISAMIAYGTPLLIKIFK
jgi:hypothetical protein